MARVAGHARVTLRATICLTLQPDKSQGIGLPKTLVNYKY
jgi:hypothetical protein